MGDEVQICPAISLLRGDLGAPKTTIPTGNAAQASRFTSFSHGLCLSPASVLAVRGKTTVGTDSEETHLPGLSPSLLLGLPPAGGIGDRGRGATLTPPPPLGCWGLVAMVTGCTLPQFPSTLVPAALRPQGHGLPETAKLQLHHHVEVGAGRAMGGEESLSIFRKRNCASWPCPLVWGSSPTG